MAPFKKSELIPVPAASAGLSLLEVALSMMIIAILAVGVSSLVRTGVESQLSQRLHDNQQAVAMNIVEDLRFDLRTASSVNIASNGTQLQIRAQAAPDGSSQDVTYRLVGTELVRSAGSSVKIYNSAQIYVPRLNIQCPSGCFQFSNSNKQVSIPDLRVVPAASGNTVLDRNFGVAQYRLRNFAFTLINTTEFE